MRIAILTLILIALLLPGLRAEAVTPPRVPLRPTAAQPLARGVMSYVAREGQLTLQLDAAGLAPPRSLPAFAPPPAYVVWLADADGRLVKAGSLSPDSTGAATAALGPFPLPAGDLIVAISAEPNADVVAPTAPRDTILLSGQFPASASSPLDRLGAFLGPDWFAPILPAALGLALLRQAGRSRRPPSS